MIKVTATPTGSGFDLRMEITAFRVKEPIVLTGSFGDKTSTVNFIGLTSKTYLLQNTLSVGTGLISATSRYGNPLAPAYAIKLATTLNKVSGADSLKSLSLAIIESAPDFESGISMLESGSDEEKVAAAALKDYFEKIIEQCKKVK